MLPLLILSTAIATAVNAHPQGGSQGVLGWCATEIPRCNFSSLYDCTNRGGFTMCYCIIHCRCENKNEPPDTGKACQGQTKPDPVPAPSPKSESGDKVGDASDLGSFEEAYVPTEETTEQESPDSSEGSDQFFETASDTTQPSESEDTSATTQADDADEVDAGQDYAGQDDAGQDDAGQDDAGQDDAGQDDAGQDDAGQDDAGQDDAGQDDAGQDDADQDDAGQDDAGQDDAGEGDAGEDFDTGTA
ncbi:hypothetical protein MMC22_002587 [Lobaria immixta]|nr:hypothetical protein [Lobaria immixta]